MSVPADGSAPSLPVSDTAGAGTLFVPNGGVTRVTIDARDYERDDEANTWRWVNDPDQAPAPGFYLERALDRIAWLEGALAHMTDRAEIAEAGKQRLGEMLEQLSALVGG